MKQQKITVNVEIATDEQYCDDECDYVRVGVGFARCQLFQATLQKFLGGGPLRCNDCLAAEKGLTRE